ncbi:hypothetical protein D8770_27140 [Methylobacterium sp. DB1607]|nr:hypothetical protein [Methylobacterium sp. DB1607]
MIGATDVAAERVNRTAKDLDSRRRVFEQISHRRQELASRISQVLEERRGRQSDLEEHGVKLAALEAKLPPSDEEVRELEASVKVGQQRVEALGRDRAAALKSYRELMKSAGSIIQGRHARIKENFQMCVKAFLEEDCELNYRERDRSVGQGGERVRFPGFDVMLTSGTFPDTPTPRLNIEDVSESQKEFIDLAFRIALIRTASEGQGAMLVLETPEASLDSLFIYRAGDLLRDFADDGGEVGNVLVASSNLNDANMIPALLGIDREPATPAEKIRRRMVNLLEYAAKNAALNARGPQYQAQYTAATTPRPDRLPDL